MTLSAAGIVKIAFAVFLGLWAWTITLWLAFGLVLQELARQIG